MPSSAPQISAAAIEALAKRRYSQNAEHVQYEPNWDGEKEEHRQVWRDRALPDLQAAYPHLLAAWTEQVEEMAELRGLNSDCGWVVSITDLEYGLERLADTTKEGTDAP